MTEEMASEIVAQGVKALISLQEYGEKREKKTLFPDLESGVLLVVKYKRIPMSNADTRRHFIQLPCPDRSPSNASICLILPDLDRSLKAQKDPDVDAQSREWAELLREKYGITTKDYAKIFTLTQLKREYSQHPDRAKLANSYDIFMVDSTLMLETIHFFGTHFKKSKLPLPINAHRKSFPVKLRESYSIAQMTVVPLKDSVTIRFGNLAQNLTELESNLSAVVKVLLQNCPGGFINIRSCNVQSLEVSLPIFVDFGPASEVKLSKFMKRKYEEEIGDCVTLPDGLAVKVRADGDVKVVDAKTGDEVLYPTEQDEWEATDDLRPLSQEMVDKIVRRKAQKLRTSRKKTKSQDSSS